MSLRTLIPWLAASILGIGAVSAAARAETSATIVADVPGACRLAAPATGQTLFILDDQARSVTAVDPFAPTKRWPVIGPADFDADSPAPVRPLAIACIDSNTLAVVCRTEAAWSLQAFRLAPAGADEPAPKLLQSLPLGAGVAMAATAVDVFVSDTRDWLAVVGLPSPLPPVLRAPIAGARLGGFSERLCPADITTAQLEAVTASPFDEWVVFTRRASDASGPTGLTFHANTGRHRLLDLGLSLAEVRDAAYCRGNGTLWVAAEGDGTDAGTAGLWRIDSGLEGGRQIGLPVAVARLTNPLSVVCLSERAIAVCGGGTSRRVLLVNPAAPPGGTP